MRNVVRYGWGHDETSQYPEIYKLGHEQGYSDDEIAEAIQSFGSEATLNYLRKHAADKP